MKNDLIAIGICLTVAATANIVKRHLMKKYLVKRKAK